MFFVSTYNRQTGRITTRRVESFDKLLAAIDAANAKGLKISIQRIKSESDRPQPVFLI